MKYLFILLSTLISTGCVKKAQIEFTGSTPGIKDGVFLIKTISDSTVFGENIKDGKFKVHKQPLKYAGYYLMNISESGSADKNIDFEVYLDNGTYTIETIPGDLYLYPKITSPSKIQDQLSAFHSLSDKLSVNAEKEEKILKARIKAEGEKMSKDAYVTLINKLAAVDLKMMSNNTIALKQFVTQYPNSDITAHLMSKMNYEDDPATYNALFKTFTATSKNSDDGKEISEKLSHLIKLVPGAKAPALAGKTPGGQLLDPKSLDKKIYIIDFWRAVNELSRKNHSQLMDILNQFKGKLGIISVSMDTKMDWWTNAINEDKMGWTQISDLKSDDSPNTANWNITKIPTYYLIDSNWNIVARDVDVSSIPLEISTYLKKHN